MSTAFTACHTIFHRRPQVIRYLSLSLSFQLSSSLYRSPSFSPGFTAGSKLFYRCPQSSLKMSPTFTAGYESKVNYPVIENPNSLEVQLGTHSFTFNHVCGSSRFPSSAMFEDSVSPLVDGLFQGYNATVVVLMESFVTVFSDFNQIDVEH
ncbi:hypothetical protein L1887_08801 [Cichorium endivia]|nr:hypothetical protein L1887_08801 [Cichorium endivia]